MYDVSIDNYHNEATSFKFFYPAELVWTALFSTGLAVFTVFFERFGELLFTMKSHYLLEKVNILKGSNYLLEGVIIHDNAYVCYGCYVIGLNPFKCQCTVN